MNLVSSLSMIPIIDFSKLINCSSRKKQRVIFSIMKGIECLQRILHSYKNFPDLFFLCLLYTCRYMYMYMSID